MSRTLSNLLASIPDETGRNEVLELGRQVHQAGGFGQDAGKDDAEQRRLLETMGERIRWHFRAARYAVPRADELERMIDEHFR